MATVEPTFRENRERELIEATRALFDQRGVQEAPMEEVAKMAGINRGLVYRQFSSKEELFVLTATHYLTELAERLRAAIASKETPREQLEGCVIAFTDYCTQYPAFLDCAMSLMRRPASELNAAVSASVWFRLGVGMAGCIDQLAEVLRRGNETGEFEVSDPDLTANFLYTGTLGAMHLGRIGVGIRQPAPSVPDLFRVTSDDVQQACLASALAIVTRPAG
jgi:AcrR family transcriptional regulator